METTETTTIQYVKLDPDQMTYLVEISQGNTYAVVGVLFMVVVVLGGVFLTTLLR